jgi:hypothetical protein
MYVHIFSHLARSWSPIPLALAPDDVRLLTVWLKKATWSGVGSLRTQARCTSTNRYLHIPTHWRAALTSLYATMCRYIAKIPSNTYCCMCHYPPAYEIPHYTCTYLHLYVSLSACIFGKNKCTSMHIHACRSDSNFFPNQRGPQRASGSFVASLAASAAAAPSVGAAAGAA